MNTYAIIENSTVVNVILWDGVTAYAPPTGIQAVAVPSGTTVGIGYSYANGVFTAPAAPTPPALTPPALTLSQQATKLYNTGCAIASTSTAALNGTYAVAGNAMSTIFAEMISILANGTFTNGTTTFAYPDTSMTPHDFTVTQFKTLATALGLFGNTCTAIIASNAGTLPTQPAIIP